MKFVFWVFFLTCFCDFFSHVGGQKEKLAFLSIQTIVNKRQNNFFERAYL